MTHPRLLECSFLIPLVRDSHLSDGQPHDPDLWEWLDDEVLWRFGGRTLDLGRFEGFYLDPDTGEKVFDVSRKYVVAVPEDRLDELRALLSVASFSFAQKCIYLSIAGQVEFIEGPSHGQRE